MHLKAVNLIVLGRTRGKVHWTLSKIKQTIASDETTAIFKTKKTLTVKNSRMKKHLSKQWTNPEARILSDGIRLFCYCVVRIAPFFCLELKKEDGYFSRK